MKLLVVNRIQLWEMFARRKKKLFGFLILLVLTWNNYFEENIQLLWLKNFHVTARPWYALLQSHYQTLVSRRKYDSMSSGSSVWTHGQRLEIFLFFAASVIDKIKKFNVSFVLEHFTQVLIDSTALYTLSICEVCGSFQCPYCPYYNRSMESARFFKVLLLIPAIFIMMFNCNN